MIIKRFNPSRRWLKGTWRGYFVNRETSRKWQIYRAFFIGRYAFGYMLVEQYGTMRDAYEGLITMQEEYLRQIEKHGGC